MCYFIKVEVGGHLMRMRENEILSEMKVSTVKMDGKRKTGQNYNGLMMDYLY